MTDSRKGELVRDGTMLTVVCATTGCEESAWLEPGPGHARVLCKLGWTEVGGRWVCPVHHPARVARETERRRLAGLKDKLYWRFPTHTATTLHCYRRDRRSGFYVSLCGDNRRTYSNGQECARPEAVMRCSRCDRLEAARRGWEESGPTLVPAFKPGRPR